MARTPDSEETKRLKRSGIGEETKFVEIKNDPSPPDPPKPENTEKVETPAEEPTVTKPTGGIDMPPDEPLIPIPDLGGDPDSGGKKRFNPLEGDSKASQRSYTKGTGAPPIAEVKEVFTPPNQTPPPEDPTNPTEPQSPPPPVNPEMPHLSDTDQRKASERLFDAGVQAYKQILEWIEMGVKIKDTKVAELIKNDEITLWVPITFTDESSGEITMMPLNEAIELFNEHTAKTFAFNQAFIDQIRESVINEFMKRKIGLTDQNNILVYCVLEVIRIGVGVWQLTSFKRKMFKDAKATHAEEKKNVTNTIGNQHPPTVNFQQQPHNQQNQNPQQNQQQNPNPAPENPIEPMNNPPFNPDAPHENGNVNPDTSQVITILDTKNEEYREPEEKK